MKDAIELNIGGIKCDACDYNDMSVKVEDYPAWVNAPCPKCGENLLTEADFRTVQTMLQLVQSFNQTLPKRSEDEKTVKMSAEMNGTGKVDFKHTH